MTGNTSATGGYLTPVTDSPDHDGDLARLLHRLVVGVAGIPDDLARPKWQTLPPKMPELDVNWATFGVRKVSAENAQIIHYGSDNNGLGDSHLITNESIEAVISFYGPNCWGIAALFRDGLWISQNREALFLIGIGITSIGEINSMSELVNNQWQQRADMVLVFTREVGRTYQVLNLVSAQGSIHMVGGSHHPTIDEPFDTLNK